MNYISYTEIHAPKDQEQSPVSANSIHVYSLETMDSSLQSEDCTVYGQSQDYTHNRPDCPRRTQSCNQSKINHKTHTQVSWFKNSVTINGKTCPLLTTKEYILHEYADVFKGVGTLPGGPYHKQLKNSYRPAQHQPRSVPLRMQSACKAELDRLVKAHDLSVSFLQSCWYYMGW